MDSCPSRFRLVELTTGELPAAAKAKVDSHLATCARCRMRLQDLCDNVATFEAKQPEHLALLRARLADEQPADRGAPARPWGWRWLPTLALPLAAAAALLLVWIPARERSRQGSRAGPATVAFKGTLSARVVAKRGKEQFVVKRGARLTEGDALRFVLTSPAGYVTVFSIDARHETVAFYPETDPVDDPAPLRLHERGRQVLPGSIVLDDSVGPEQLVIAFSERPFRRDELHRRFVRLLKKEGPAALTARRLGIPLVRVPVIKEQRR